MIRTDLLHCPITSMKRTLSFQWSNSPQIENFFLQFWLTISYKFEWSILNKKMDWQVQVLRPKLTYIQYFCACCPISEIPFDYRMSETAVPFWPSRSMRATYFTNVRLCSHSWEEIQLQRCPFTKTQRPPKLESLPLSASWYLRTSSAIPWFAW